MATTFDAMIRKPRSSMLIVCPHCVTCYVIETSALGDEGRSVRCMRCQTVWFASVREPALEIAGAPEAEVMAQTPADSWDQAAAAAEGEFHGEASEPAGVAAETADGPAAANETQPLSDAQTPDLIEEGPPLVPGHEQERQFAPGEGPFPITGGDVEVFARRKASKRAKQKLVLTLPKFKWPLAPLPTLLVGLGAAVTILIGWRADTVRRLPQTAAFYSAIGLDVNLRGLAFENIKISPEAHEGIPVMVIEGEIVSISRKTVEVPRLRFGVRNGLGAEIYNWTAMPSRTVAAAGDRVPFRSRLASPPAETHDISVRFYNRHDMAAR